MLAEAPSPNAAAASRPLRLSVIGAGYVGLVSGACLSALGHDVTVVEIDPARLDALSTGHLPLREPGLDGVVVDAIAAGRLRFTSNHWLAVVDADLVMIAVGTPMLDDGHVDLSAVETAVCTTALASPSALIALKSTVPPGTAARMEQVARSLGAEGVRVVSNPEFLREGRAVHDFMSPDRVVIGARDRADGELVAELYESLGATTYHCLPEEAELAKYAANSMLAARISFMNELSGIADIVGADIQRVATLVGSDARIGSAFLQAGLGWGGSCFPKDVRGLAAVADDLGVPAPMLRATVEANDRQHLRALREVLRLVDGIAGPRVAVLGVAFKPLTDDVRESPALRLACALASAGVDVRASDPWALAHASRIAPGLDYELDPMNAVAGADVTVLATEWPEFVALDWGVVAARMRGAAVLDARNALNAHAIEVAGLRYRSLGRNVTAQEGVACAS